MESIEDICNKHDFGDVGKNWLEDAVPCWSFTSENLNAQDVKDIAACVLGVLGKESEVIQHTCVTVSDLKQYTSSCMVRLTHSPESVQSPSPCLQRRSLILVAKLEAMKRNDSQYSEVILSDKKDAIRCKFQIGLSLKLNKNFNKNLLVTDWNLIHDDKQENQLEVVSFVPIKADATNPRDIYNVLTMEAVKIILSKKSVKSTSKLINVQGTVTALSEIYRVKRDTFFCVQLDNRINILVKHPEKIHWHQLLNIKNEYLFSLLKPTTLSKGAVCEQRLLVPSSKSEVLCPVSTGVGDITEQLKAMGFENEEEMLGGEVCDDSGHEEGVGYSNELTSYEGTVTDNGLSNFGIYILDEQVGLYISCVPTLRNYKELRVGTRIVVSNVHMKGTKQVPKLRLLCCGISSIHIVAFSSINITAKALDLPECLRQLFFRVGVNIKELLGVVETVNVMTSKFAGLVSSRTVTAIMQKLIPSTMLEACSSRNTLDEILSSPHHCCLMEEKQRPFIIPRVVEISDILKFSETVIENLMDEGRYNLNRQRENKKLSTAVYWLHHCEKVLSSDNKMLIGILKPCSVTGKMVLQDRTGKVFVLIKKDERDVSIDSNMISKSSLCELCNGNRVVALSRYRVVYEQFQVCDLQRPEQFGDIQYVQKHSEIIYVECSIEDIEIINSESSSDLERQSKYSELIFVEKKEALILEGTNPESSLLRFNVKGYSLGKLRDFDDKECLLAQGKCVSTMFDGQSSSQTRGNLTHKCSPESRVFIFDGNAARWHSIIEENVLYRISSSKELSAVTMKQYSFQLQKVIERADKKACVQLPEDVEMLRMTCQLHGAKCPNPEFVMSQMTRESLSSITDILSSSCYSTFVSFKGEVIHRSHSDIRASDVISPSLQDAMSSHCVGTLDNRNIMLIVKCMDTGNQIQVFLTLQNMAYPLGLHPGAVIIFRRLERRQKNDRVYCQYICISSIDVMGFEKEDRGEHREETTSQYRNQVLKEMEGIKELHREESQVAVFDYIANGNFGNPFSCVAYIRWMIKLSLKCVCVNCHCVISSGKCDAGQCSGNDGFQFVARATAVFDDGTGSGIASFTGDGVRALLTLTQEQWISIQELVLQKGEIFIDENTPCVDAIEKFLSALCTSSVIKSPHVITLSVQKDRQNLDKHTDLNACKLEDLPLKPVDVGGESVSIRTRFLPASYFYCLTIRPLDNTEWTRYNLR